MFDLVVRNASEVLRVTGTAPQPAEEALAPLSRGAVGIRAGRVAFLGPEGELPQEELSAETQVVDAGGGFVGPGFVDAHTHLVFAGERSAEHERRCQGASYLEIAAAGGGIASTVLATRAATENELVALAQPRLRRLLEQGVTLAEVKSGYGLELEAELKILRAIRRLGALQPVDLVATLLCAHAIPEEHREDRAAYVELCVERIIPKVAEDKLARFCDVFVEQGAFTPDEARRILGAAKALGLRPRLHVDQLSAGGGAELAAELQAASADHLEEISDEGIAALAAAGTTALLVPTSTLFLRQRRYAPGRRLRDAGVNVALGTNVNPGSAMSENLALTLGLGVLENGLSAAEAYWAVTRGGALALEHKDAGKLEVGGPADLVVFSCRSYRHLPYHLAVNHARVVVKAGEVVHRTEGAAAKLCD